MDINICSRIQRDIHICLNITERQKMNERCKEQCVMMKEVTLFEMSFKSESSLPVFFFLYDVEELIENQYS